MYTKSFRRKAPVLLGLLVALVAFSGCPLSPDGDDGKEPVDPRVPERTSVQGAIELYQFAWAQQRYDLYEQLLHDSFEYFPRSDDIDDFPWLLEDSWGRTTELGMAANMFDDAFVSDDTGNSVDSIEMDLATQNERSVPEGVEVTTSADITVLWAENTGATSDVRFVFTVVPDPDEPGKFQLLKQSELAPF
jgi:hypothetical protein